MQISWIKAPHIRVPHGFSTRQGGVSPPPFHSLNFGGSDDREENISENRKRALSALGILHENVAHLKQVHGIEVCTAKPGLQTGDALVTKEKNLALAIGAADCYPLLFHDPVHHVIGAAHAGWRGTLARIVKHTIEAMVKLGAEKATIRAAIGPGISGKNYEVSEEVIEKFRHEKFPAICFDGRKLDLLAANKFVLSESGISPENTWALNRCTTEDDFFSYRRDQGKTGRMWAVIVQQL